MSIKEVVKEEFELDSYEELKKRSPRLFKILNRLDALQQTIAPVSLKEIERALR